jgi:hypothetical protein
MILAPRGLAAMLVVLCAWAFACNGEQSTVALGAGGAQAQAGTAGASAAGGGAGSSELFGAGGVDDVDLVGPNDIECGATRCDPSACCAPGDVCGVRTVPEVFTQSCVVSEFSEGEVDATCPESSQCLEGRCETFAGCMRAEDGLCGYWVAGPPSCPEDCFDWVYRLPTLGCVPPDWIVAGALDGGSIGDASMGADGRGGVDAAASIDAASCDLGCAPLNDGQIGGCANDEVEWMCNTANDLDRFNENCSSVPVNSIRYCCPATFLAACQ